jgi:polyhydroxybutyrate depolymerase
MLTANVRFVSDLIDTLMGHYSIDPRRVYLNGFSNGGAGVFALSCRLSARLAAVGTVSAAQDLPWMSCADTTPVPLINFHGTADLVPYTGGRSVFSPRPFPDVEQWTARWAARNHCTLGPVVASVAPDVRRASYQSCARDADVLLFTIQGGGHAWPGGKPFPVWLVGRTTMSIDATELMWAFFQQHPKPSP